MLKPVKSVIAASRVLIRRPSEQKLATEDCRLLLHQALEELNQHILFENKDFFTHELDAALTYDSELRGYTVEISSGRVNLKPEGIDPVFLLCQETSSDPQTDPWSRIRVVELSTFNTETNTEGEATAAFVGNTWQQDLSVPHFKINLTDDVIAGCRFRIAFRYFPQELLDLDDTVPFPASFSSLLEHSLAQKALSLVRDDSPSWISFARSRGPELLVAVERQKASLVNWLHRNLENSYVTQQPYHYRVNNPLHGRPRRPRVQW